MRPIKKWNIGENGIVERYIPYKNAKELLVENIDEYCSYCEIRVGYVSLEVEHVKPKDLYEDDKTKWENFILGCKNCNTIKGTTDVSLDDYHFPHIHNTFHSLEYLEGGLVRVNPGLERKEKLKAQKLLELVGLDRRPGHPRLTIADKRWQYRKNTYDLAKKYKQKLISGDVDIEVVIDLAKGYGFWSVWMKVFNDNSDVITELIKAFKGTYLQCSTSDVNRL